MKSSDHPDLVLSVADLEMPDRKTVRSIILLSAKRLQDHWHVSEVLQGSQCRLVPPDATASPGLATLELFRQGGSRLAFELPWPVTEKSLVDALNRAGMHHRQAPPEQSRGAGMRGWLASMIGGLRSKAPSMPDDHRAPLQPPPALGGGARPDLRANIAVQLARFGKRPARPSYNILLVGSPGSGKTTAIGSTSDIPTCSTEVAATDTVALLKSRTTVALDFGQVALPDCLLRLYGTPGQLRFAHMIEQTLATCDAALVLVDATSHDPLGDVARYVPLLKAYGNGRGQRPLLVAYTHVDMGALPRNFSQQLAEALGQKTPTLPMDPRDRASVLRALGLLASACSNHIADHANGVHAKHQPA